MVQLLLPIIYISFISLGLPDSLLGSAWPSMYPALGVPVSYAGLISMIISFGTIVSSLNSDRLTRALGTGKVTALSVAMTAAALFGFSVSTQFWMLCLWAVLLSKDALTTRLQVLAVLRGWEGELRRANAAGTQEAFDLLRGQFQSLADEREKAQQTASAALEAAFDFMEQAFAESQEMVVFVTELTLNPASHAFITENGCDRYFRYNKDLLLDHRKAALQQELAAEYRPDHRGLTASWVC